VSAMVSPSRRVIGLPGDPGPFGPLTLSAFGHLVAVGIVFFLSAWWSHRETSKVYIVNLVPSLPSPSSPGPTVARGREIPQPPRPRVTDSPAERIRPKESARPAPKPSPPDFALPKRGAKETPNFVPTRPDTSSFREPPRELRPAPQPTREAAAPLTPPVPLGRGAQTGPVSTGSVVGLDVSDFPFTYYLRQIQQKVSERWRAPAGAGATGQRSVVLFEILRDGRIKDPVVEQTSGDSLFDQSALRAIMEASPFPPLPQDFKASSLRVHFGFVPGEQG